MAGSEGFEVVAVERFTATNADVARWWPGKAAELDAPLALRSAGFEALAPEGASLGFASVGRTAVGAFARLVVAPDAPGGIAEALLDAVLANPDPVQRVVGVAANDEGADRLRAAGFVLSPPSDELFIHDLSAWTPMHPRMEGIELTVHAEVPAADEAAVLALEALWSEAQGFVSVDVLLIDPWPVDSAGFVILARSGDEVVGAVNTVPTWAPTTAGFGNLIVALSHRGRGLAWVLKKAQLDEAARRGVLRLQGGVPGPDHPTARMNRLLGAKPPPQTTWLRP